MKLFEMLEDIEKWNEETFPDATLGGQLEKLEEEFREFSAAPVEEKTAEFADMFIVLGGLRRFDSLVGNLICWALLERIPDNTMNELLSAIEKKMEINKQRVWKKTGTGKFHH